MEQSINAVAVNLKAARESRKLCLDSLSDITGVNNSMLRTIAP